MAPRFLDYDVQIYSSRSRYLGARRAMKNWLYKEFKNAGYSGDCVELLTFPKQKPPASILIDDRGFRFEGQFPTADQLKNMLKPWNKKNKNYEQVELIILVGNIGCGKSTYAKYRVKNNRLSTGMVVVNMDSIQQMIGGGDYGNYDSKKKEIYWAVEEKAICESLERGNSVIIDRTNMDIKRRKRFIDIARRYWWVSVTCLDWGPGSKYDLARRLKNPRGVSDDQWIKVFNKMKELYEKPTKEEGFSYMTKPKDNLIKFLREEKILP